MADEKVESEGLQPAKEENVGMGVGTSAPPYHEHGVGLVHDYANLRNGLEIHPKATADALDPLNFPKWQKWTSLAIVMWMYFLFTYITTTTVPSFPLLGAQYNITVSQQNWTVAIPALGLAVGPLIWSSLAEIYGRRIIFIVGTTIALVASIGSAVAKTYGTYMTARFFQGLGVSPASTVGMAVINDLFFDYERGQKLGLWVLAIDMGLLVGPLVGGFITLKDQYWVAWHVAILFAALLVAEVLFFPETLFPRKLMLSRLPPPTATKANEKSTAVSVDPGNNILLTKQLPFLNIWKVPGIEHPQPWDALVEFLKLWEFPNVSVAVMFYCFTWYWWVMSVVTYLPLGYPTYKPQIQGLLYIGLILGTLFSEVLCSGTLGDWLVLRLARKNNNVRVAEMRLWMAYPAALSSAVGLILWGISIDKGYHWMVGQVALFLFAAGIQMGGTAISAYIVDCYPMHAMSVIIFWSVLLNLSAFINPFYIVPWVDRNGPTAVFSTQGVITYFVAAPTLWVLQRYGGIWREWRGAPSWISPEYA